MKEFLSVTGNGRSTLRELILADQRASLQIDRLLEATVTALPMYPPTVKR